MDIVYFVGYYVFIMMFMDKLKDIVVESGIEGWIMFMGFEVYCIIYEGGINFEVLINLNL